MSEKPEWQKALEEARGGTTSNNPKLNIVKSFTVERKKDGDKVYFSWWDKDAPNENGGTGMRMYYNKPLVGVFIGAAMQASAFHDDLGRNGGNYQSALYTRKDHIVMYGPDGNGKNKKVFEGTKDELSQWVAINTSSRALKVRQIWFVIIDNIGLCMMDTNMSISIDQLDKKKDTLVTEFLVMKPDVWREDHPDITKGTFPDKRLPVVRKNPPLFVNIVNGMIPGGPITEEFVVKYDVIGQAKNYKLWREWKDKGGKSVEDKPEDRQSGLPHNAQPIHNVHELPEPTHQAAYPGNIPGAYLGNLPVDEEESDLPF